MGNDSATTIDGNICWHGDTDCKYDHRKCGDCGKEFEDCACHLDQERAEHLRASFRVAR